MVSRHAKEDARRIREQQCDIEGCQMSETGVCALHDVEVERRKGMKELVDKIPDIMTKLNWVLGASIGASSLAIVILIGSYTYTNIVKVSLKKDIQSVQSTTLEDNKFIRETVLSLTHNVATLQAMQAQSIKETKELKDVLKNVSDKQESYE